MRRRYTEKELSQLSAKFDEEALNLMTLEIQQKGNVRVYGKLNEYDLDRHIHLRRVRAAIPDLHNNLFTSLFEYKDCEIKLLLNSFISNQTFDIFQGLEKLRTKTGAWTLHGNILCLTNVSYKRLETIYIHISELKLKSI